MRGECRLSDEAVEALFDDAFCIGITIESVVWTRDTIENWKQGPTTWRECKRTTEDEVGGFPTLEFEGVQVHKGQERQGVYVIDLGTVRASVVL